jgi:hypothetical protein
MVDREITVLLGKILLADGTAVAACFPDGDDIAPGDVPRNTTVSGSPICSRGCSLRLGIERVLLQPTTGLFLNTPADVRTSMVSPKDGYAVTRFANRE